MHNRGQYHIGILLITLGVIFLLARVFHISIWGIIWPLALIGVGIWIMLRHKYVDEGTSINQKFIGDISRKGTWEVTNEEIQIFIGDIELDMTQATIPEGTTTIRVWGFIGDVHIYIPKTVGMTVSATGFIIDAKILEGKEDKFFASIKKNSDNFEKAKKKIQIETHYFIHDLTVKQV